VKGGRDARRSDHMCAAAGHCAPFSTSCASRGLVGRTRRRSAASSSGPGSIARRSSTELIVIFSFSIRGIDVSWHLSEYAIAVGITCVLFDSFMSPYFAD
jgi:hypothetical protein